MNFKSIIGYGKIYKVINIQEKIEGLNSIMKQYTDKDSFNYEEKMLDATTILKLEIDELTGKQKY
jgi:nitroimidazol reductase NimA-like FMN-containing flavoprotein (pyridoxamine 5'-phosphate oxidase superfamily)